MAGKLVSRRSASRVGGDSDSVESGPRLDAATQKKLERWAAKLVAQPPATLTQEDSGLEAGSADPPPMDSPAPESPLPEPLPTEGGFPEEPLPDIKLSVASGIEHPDSTFPASVRDDSGAASTPDGDGSQAPFADYEPVTLSRMRPGGWTAERQRKFLVTLAETGSVSEASIMSGVSARSAYRLRQRLHATAFADAWDHALKLASLRLVTLAFERATTGTVREIWREGRLVGTTRAPSEKLLMFLIRHLMPAPRAAQSPEAFQTEIEAARTGFPRTLDALRDDDVEIVPIQSRDFFPPCPGDPRDDW